MATIPIRLWPDPVLRHPARPVTDFGERLERLIEDMLETMYDAPGVGLAAPQIGVERRIFVYDAGDGGIALINPKIVSSAGSDTDEEGCLSIPGIYYPVTRPASVVVVAQDPTGAEITAELDEMEARIVQHELDHLDGIVFLDRLEPDVRKEAMTVMRERLMSGFQPPRPTKAVL